MLPTIRDMTIQDRKVISKTYTIGTKEITFETGKLALFAQGSVTIKDSHGNYLLTTTGVGGQRDGDFFPLSVDFQEKYYANGKIGGNRFMKREGRPSDMSILTSRMIDRPIRPMFSSKTRSEIQIISTILSSTGESEFGWYGITGASLSIQLAGITDFEAPVSGVRIISDQDGNFIFDPTFDEIENAHLDLTVAGTSDAITMVESQGNEVDSELMVKAFEFAHDYIKDLCAAQEDFLKLYQETYEISEIKLIKKEIDEELEVAVKRIVEESDIEGLYGLGKVEFHDAIESIIEGVIEEIAQENVGKKTTLEEAIAEVPAGEIADIIKSIVKAHMRKTVLETGKRLDGRECDQVRPVRADTSLLDRTHGTGLFERGVTQILSIATLGGPQDMQLIDGMYEEETKRYIHHYNFPPFSVGDVRPLRGVGRREIGHGRLAEKALEPVLPKEEDFPYMMRVVSETMTCNGSSSMASICGSSLALMDAGVPIKAMVAGVAMGMIYDEETRNYKVLADIQAQEDFLGDMDFKVAATEDGITALQMDCKISGLSMEVIKEVFKTSEKSIAYIRENMQKAISEPRKELSKYAPLLSSLQVPEDKMRDVIGKGGETIQGIEKDFGVEVNLDDDGKCTITAKSQEEGKKAVEFIQNLLKEVEVGDEYEGTIIKILDTIGAIVSIGPGKEGMIHISKFGEKKRIENVNDIAKVGDIVKVKVYSVDKEKGRIGLMKVV
ncbi:polyribonucleotide nucleotidyltransferase [Candidatus Gracilibacteria bacterium]|nr:polyribonucleotide nucleotidyltransferase [Candidatus Gracilibacteria bacterium]